MPLIAYSAKHLEYLDQCTKLFQKSLDDKAYFSPFNNKNLWNQIRNFIGYGDKFPHLLSDYFERAIHAELEKKGVSDMLRMELREFITIEAGKIVNSLYLAKTIDRLGGNVVLNTGFAEEEDDEDSQDRRIREFAEQYHKGIVTFAEEEDEKDSRRRYSWKEFVKANMSRFSEASLNDLVKQFLIYNDFECYNRFQNRVKSNPQKFPLLNALTVHKDFRAILRGECVDTFALFRDSLCETYFHVFDTLNELNEMVESELEDAIIETHELNEDMKKLEEKHRVAMQKLEDDYHAKKFKRTELENIQESFTEFKCLRTF